MDRHRRKGEFHPAAALDWRKLGVPAAEARKMVLLSAWERAAGPEIGRRARPVEVRRGTLVIESADGLDVTWVSTLDSLLPEVAGRVAQLAPSLGIRRVRLDRGRPVGVRTPERPSEAAEAALTPSPDIREVMERYLERAASVDREG